MLETFEQFDKWKSQCFRGDFEAFFNRYAKDFNESDIMLFVDVMFECPFNIDNGPWLAGGAVRATLQDQPIKSDYDIFFANEIQLHKCRDELIHIGAKKIKENDHNETYFFVPDETDPSVKLEIQLIKHKYYNNVYELLDSFDYTICQFATDGKELVCGPYALWDLARKRLAIHRITYPVASMRRMIKYANKGFTVCGGMLTDFIRRIQNDSNDMIISEKFEYID